VSFSLIWCVLFLLDFTVKPAEPFGDISKRHARSTLMQRTVEITCTGVTMGGVITGDLMVGQGGQRRDFCLEMISSGLATVDQRKIDYGEAPRKIVEAQTAAQNNRVGIWSLEQEKRTEVRLCFFYSTKR
jgi:staphylococcal nuclease domain-containing protein 1